MSYQISVYSVEKLSDFSEIQPGFAFKSNQFIDDREQTPLVKGENLQQGYVDWNASKYWRSDEYEELWKYHLVQGDIVIAMDRPWVTAGLKWSYIKKHDPKSLLVQRVARLRAKKGLDQTYLRYLISSEYFSLYVQPIVTGVNVPHISGKQIGDFRVPIPNLITQKKIAAILSAYDDLIENNKRRIALLENMAEEIYREWFVRFRFPGYQMAEFENRTPKGWKVKLLSDVAVINLSNLKKTNAPEYIEYIDIRSVTTNNIGESVIYHRDEAPGRAKRLVKHGDIIWSSVRPANRAYSLILRPNKNLVVSTGFAVITPIKEEYYPFIYQATTTDGFVDQITAVAKGAAYPATSFDDYGKTKILTPDGKLIREYYKNCNPVYEEIYILKTANNKLNASKNMLLPRLISGKLRVENLNIQFPPSMQTTTEAE